MNRLLTCMLACLLHTSLSSLKGRVALVTGCSRGIGRGIALGLAEQGCTVYCTARSMDSSSLTDSAGGTLESLISEIAAAGGKGRAISCDHSKDDQVQRVFDTIEREVGRLDILVNNAFCVPRRPDGKDDPELLFRDFWEQPGWFYDSFMDVGLRSHYIASGLAVPLMRRAAEQRPLIVHISSFGGVSYSFNVAYGAGKAAVDRLAKDMAIELRKLNVDCISLWPGVVRTERMAALLDGGDFQRRTGLHYPIQFLESPLLAGRVVAAIYADQSARSGINGRVQIVAEVARDKQIRDPVSGAIPPSIRSLRFLLPAVLLGKMTPEERGRNGWLERLLMQLAPDWLLPLAVMGAGPPTAQGDNI